MAKKKKRREVRHGIKWVIVALLFFILLTLYLIFFYSSTCEDEECFRDALWGCSRTSFTTATEDWQYEIKGMKKDLCVVEVKALELINVDVETAKRLRGKSMLCYIPEEIAGARMPQERLGYCHGLLKEAIQDLMIERLHLYIVQNIGKINQSLVRPV